MINSLYRYKLVINHEYKVWFYATAGNLGKRIKQEINTYTEVTNEKKFILHIEVKMD